MESHSQAVSKYLDAPTIHLVNQTLNIAPVDEMFPLHMRHKGTVLPSALKILGGSRPCLI